MPFVQALTAIGLRPVLLSGPADVKVVDVAIVRTLEALAERGHGDVMLVSHDGDFAPHLVPLLTGDRRRVGIVAFRELTSAGLMELAARGVDFHDLEDDIGAFTVSLPRLRVVAIEDFDPWALLG
jgi:putative heme uptake system protein